MSFKRARQKYLFMDLLIQTRILALLVVITKIQHEGQTALIQLSLGVPFTFYLFYLREQEGLMKCIQPVLSQRALSN